MKYWAQYYTGLIKLHFTNQNKFVAIMVDKSASKFHGFGILAFWLLAVLEPNVSVGVISFFIKLDKIMV